MEKYSCLKNIAGYKVKSKDNKDGVKYYLEDGRTWVLVRPSGTEPLLRIYFETDSREKAEELKNFF